MDMIERVARAICRARICGPRDHLDQQEGLHWRSYELEARAAIEAMREPTTEIIKAHHLVPEDNDFDERAARNWTNLIDAALATETVS